MSRIYERVKKYYDDGFWSAEWVRQAEGVWLTKEEVDEILGVEEEE